MGDYTAIIVAVASLIGIFITNWRVTRLVPHEERHKDADAAKTYAEAAQLLGERVIRLEKQMGELKRTQWEQEREIKRLRDKNKKLEDWAKRLVDQIRFVAPGVVPEAYDA